MSTITIVIASQFADFRHNLRNCLINGSTDCRINEVDDFFQLGSIMHVLQPDLLLCDAGLLSFDAVADIENIFISSHYAKIIVLGDYFSDAFIIDGLQHGVRGFLMLPVQPEILVKAVHVVQQGTIWLARERLAHIVMALCQEREGMLDSLLQSPSKITAREWDIIKGVSQGMTNKEIAKWLNLSDKTIKVHLGHIFCKLQVQRRTQLAFYQLKNPRHPLVESVGA